MTWLRTLTLSPTRTPTPTPTLSPTSNQALLGFTRTIRHLDGHSVTIANAGVSQPHQVLTLKDEGMPTHNMPSEFGSLRVELVFNLPSKLSPAERDFLRDPTHLAGATDAADIPAQQPSVFGGNE